MGLTIISKSAITKQHSNLSRSGHTCPKPFDVKILENPNALLSTANILWILQVGDSTLRRRIKSGKWPKHDYPAEVTTSQRYWHVSTYLNAIGVKN